MKKILIFIIGIISILSFYLFHDYRNITQLTFVNSIGLDYNEETKEYTMYFFILNNYTIAQTGNSASFTNTHAYTTKASDKEILLAENKIRDNSNTKFDLSHVRSFVIKTSFFKNDNILKLINYIKNSNKYSPSFEIYTTDDSLDELYKLENFSEVSGYYTILVNTQNNIPVKHVTYSDLCNDIYIKDYVVPYQKLKINKGIITDSEKEYITLSFDGCTFINDSYNISSFKYQNLHGVAYFTSKINRPIVIEHDSKSYTFSANMLKITHKVKDNKLLITIKINGSFIDNNNIYNVNLENILKEKLTNDISIMYQTFNNYDIDFFNISYRYNNKYNYKELDIDFDIKIISNNHN